MCRHRSPNARVDGGIRTDPPRTAIKPALSALASVARSAPSLCAARSSVARSLLSLVATSASAKRAGPSSVSVRRRNACETRAETSSGAPSGARARSSASDASSSSASGLPAVALCSRSAVTGATPSSSVAASLLVSPPIRSVGRSAPSSSDGSPSRTVRMAAIGSATSRRNANSSAWALDPSSQWASSTSTATGPLSAYAASRPSVAAPTAKRSWRLAGRSARALSSATACGRGSWSSITSAGRNSSSRDANGIWASDCTPRALQYRHPFGAARGVIEQRRLADPGFPDERQRRALPRSRPRQGPLDLRPLVVPAEQHAASLGATES